MKGPELSIIIVTWNTKNELSACLHSIRRETPGLSHEVIVVDNASSDGTAAMVRNEFPWVCLIANHENMGFGRANNQGYRISCGDYILFLNPDTEIRDRAIEKAVAFMKNRPSAWLVGVRAVHPDGFLQVSTAYFPSLATVWTNGVPLRIALSMFGPFKWFFKTPAVYTDAGLTLHEAGESRPVDYVLGQFMLTRRDVLERVGLFDESVFMYDEEADLCYRIHRAGGEVWYVPEAVILHHERRSIDQLSKPLRYDTEWFLSSRGWFMAKHHGKVMKWLFYLMTALSSFLKMPIYALAWFFDGKRRRYFGRRLLYHGYILRWYLVRPFAHRGGRP